MAAKFQELILECERHYENCLITCAALRIWLRFLLWVRRGFATVSVLAASLATWELTRPADLPSIQPFGTIGGFLATVLPLIYMALKFEEDIGATKYLVIEYMNLRDSFRRAALVSSKNDGYEFERECNILFDRLERARSLWVEPLDFCFTAARRNVTSGRFDLEVDQVHDNKQQSTKNPRKPKSSKGKQRRGGSNGAG